MKKILSYSIAVLLLWCCSMALAETDSQSLSARGDVVTAGDTYSSSSSNLEQKKFEPDEFYRYSQEYGDLYLQKLQRESEYQAQYQYVPITTDILLTEGFEGGALPAGWSDMPGGASAWAYDGGVDHGPGSAHTGSYAAYFNIYDYWYDTYDTLATPSIDFSAHSGAYLLTYWSWHNSGSDSVVVFLSEAGVLTRLHKLPNTTAWSLNSVLFNSTSANGKIYFVGYSNFGFYNLYIDDVQIADAPTTGRCCYGPVTNPSCADNTHSECDALQGTWAPGLNCTSNPCPVVPFGDICAAPIIIPSIPYTDSRTSCGFNNDYGYSGADVVYQMTLATAMVLDIDLCSSPTEWDTQISVWASNMCGTTTYIASMDGGCNTTYNLSKIDNLSLAAGTYYILVDGWSGSCNDYTLSVVGGTPCVADFSVTAPGTWSGHTAGAGDDCGLRTGPDHIYEVTIPHEGDWEIGFCGGDSAWDAYMFLGTACCMGDIGYDDDGCDGANPAMPVMTRHLTAGVYYVDFEPFSSTSLGGPYTLSVTEVLPCATCPPVFVPEGEPNCGPGYVDTYNGGCNSTPPVFSTYNWGDVVCGTSGNWVTARDTDWYRVVITDRGTISMKGFADFPLQMNIIVDPTGDCSGDYTIISVTGPRCDTVQLSYLVDPGTYYLFVAPSTWTGWPCPQDYTMSATFTIAPPCIVTCPPGGIVDAEPNCYDEYVDATNGGCNWEPNVFGTIACGQTICGTAGTYVYTDSTGPNDYRDMDWFNLNLTERKLVTVSGQAEFDYALWILQGPCASPVQKAFASGGDCVTVTASAILDPGDYYIVAAPAVWTGVACNSEYFVTVTCVDPPVVANDLCANATPLTVPALVTDSTDFATVDVVPTCVYTPTAPGIWYSVAGTGNTMTAAMCDPATAYDTRLNVYCHTCDQLVCVDGDDDDCTDPWDASTVTWCSDITATYYILVHGYNASSLGTFTLSLTDNGVPCTGAIVCGVPEFGVVPTAVTGQAEPGGSASQLLTVSNTGAAELTADIAVYIDPPAPLASLQPAGNDPKSAVKALPTPAKLPDNGIAPPKDPNMILQGGEDCSNFFDLGNALPVSDTGHTIGYTSNYGPFAVRPASWVGNFYTSSCAGPDVTYKWTAPAAGYYDFSLCPSGFDTGLLLYAFTCPTEPTEADLIAGNDDGDCATIYRSLLAGIQLSAGQAILIVVDGYGTSTGDYTLEITAGIQPPPNPECPATGVLMGHNPTLPTESWGFFTSDAEYGYVVYENFGGVFGNVDEIHFWGVDLMWTGTGWAECDALTENFVIKFYQDNGGIPGTEIASYNVTITPDTTGFYYNNTIIDFVGKSYQATLTPAVYLTSGWVSIQALTVGVDCVFLWHNSLTGDVNALQWDPIDQIYTQLYDDLAICLIGTAQAPWLSTDVSQVVVPPAGTAPVNVTMDATNLTAGTYTGDIVFSTNELSALVHTVPVTFTVGTSGCDYIPGDINNNGQANGIDIVYGVTYLKGGATPKDTCDCRPTLPLYPFYGAMDVNGNCATNGIDITFFVAYLKGLQPALKWCLSCPPPTLMAPVPGQDTPAIVPIRRSLSNQQ